MTSVVTGLNQPTSVEFIGKHAYIVGLGGDIVTLNVTKSHRRH